MSDSSDFDFESFVNTPETPAPEALSLSIKNTVKKDLNPILSYVLLKIFAIQLVAGTSTLFLCSQFGVSFFNIKGLRHLFMFFGEIGCMALCGSLFIGAGALVAMLVLRPEEIRVIWKRKEIYYSAFALIFLLSFYLIGSEHMRASIVIAWFLGSFVASKLIISAVKNFRFPQWNPSLQELAQ